MRKVIVGALLVILGIVITSFPFTIDTHFRAEKSFGVEPYSKMKIPLDLRTGDAVEGRFVVRALNKTILSKILFSIEDPLGNIIYESAIPVYEVHDFKFRAHMYGEYFLCFDNSFTAFNIVQISLNYEVLPLNMSLGFLLLVKLSGAVCIIFGLLRIVANYAQRIPYKA